VLPNQSDITTKAGDAFVFYRFSGDKWAALYGTTATRDVVSSNTDTSGGNKVVTQGWMGLGGKSKGIQIPSSGSNLNDYQHTGFYSQSTSVGATNGSNYPESRAGCLFVYPTAGNNGVGQTYYTYQGKMYIRYFENGSWGPWQEIYHTGNFPPVGYVYTQYPGTPSPSELFGGTWTLMFNTEGVFFRTEGQYALSFGSGVQEDALQGHGHTFRYNSTPAYSDNPGSGVGTHHSSTSRSAANRVTNPISLSSYGSVRYAPETRSRNLTVRVWRKTAH